MDGKDFWDFDRPADWTTRDEMIRAGLYFIATKRRYEREKELQNAKTEEEAKI